MSLSRLDRRLRLRAEDAVRRDIRYARDSTREYLKKFLEISHRAARAAPEQVVAGVGEARILVVYRKFAREGSQNIIIYRLQLVPCVAPYYAVRRKAVLLLKLHDAVVGVPTEDAVHGRGLDVVCEAADKVQEILYRAHILPSVAAFYDSLELPLDVRQPQALAVKLAELQYSGVELFYLVPGRLADNAVDGEAEYALKLFDRFARRRVEYAVGGGD